ncbi:MAG TPA: hypothetical protein VGR37_21265 [Longimicrobiaceae bacterium]|nr:hypothetical protein [Longimicrobiaceae bacterium]
MIWIRLKHKLPTDNDIPGWEPWTRERWDAWLAKSKRLLAELAAYDAAGDRDARNALIDDNSAHWGELKEWLLSLSAGKCWFSDVRDLFSHYDVEHFRPKKEAKARNGAKRDAYWWLAFDYTNFRICGNVGNRKKGAWFPLKLGSLCSTYAAPCEESEECYLLDPIEPGDVALVAFDEEGKVVPLPSASTWEHDRVVETVKRLKLNEHARLAEERRKIWQKMDRLIGEFLVARDRCRSGNNPAARAKLADVCTAIRDMTNPAAELSSVARWCLALRNDAQLTRLMG